MKLKKLAQIYADNKAKMNSLENENQGIKPKLMAKMKKLNKPFVVVDQAKVSMTKPGTVLKWDIEALKEKFDAKLVNKMLSKTVTILDQKEFLGIMKKYNVPVSEFKHTLDIQETVNEDIIDKLIDSKKISLKDLKGCYTQQEKQATIRVNLQD